MAIQKTTNNHSAPVGNRISSKIKIRGTIIVLIALIAGVYYTTEALQFDSNVTLTDIPALLGLLFLFSLFVERCTEFFLSLWRSKEADNLDRKIELLKHDLTAKKAIPEIDEAKLEQLNEDLKKVQDERVHYRSESRLAALWTSFTIGVLLGLVGVRILGSIYTGASMSPVQQALFIPADILFTGAILAGGSEAINKIMKVYNKFFSDKAAPNNNSVT